VKRVVDLLYQLSEVLSCCRNSDNSISADLTVTCNWVQCNYFEV